MPLLLTLWPLGLWAFTHRLPYWGDEDHFVATVRLFGDGITLELIRTYGEMSTPLPFVLYAWWGHLAGFDLGALRLLSPLVAAATSMLWWIALTRAAGPASRWALLALATIVLNPYFVGLSVFVFTDMPALLGLALTTLGVQARRPWQIALGLAIATLARQYLAFLAPAVLLTTALQSKGSARAALHEVIAVAIGMLPLAALIWWWGGALAPASALRDIYVAEPLHFDPHFLSLYLAIPGAYLLPLIVPVLSSPAPRPARLAGTAAAIAAFVLLFPVKGAIFQVNNNSGTVGFLHEQLTARLPAPAVHVIFFVLAAIWIAAVLASLQRARPWQGDPRTAIDLFPWIGGATFLALMPFSYMPWEKYALPLFMLGSLAIVTAQARRPAVT